MKIRNRQALIDYVNYGNPVKYLFFWSHRKHGNEVTKSCFSQWYDAPFVADGEHFLTAEHYMMYHKALLFNDKAAAKKVLKASNPGAAKEVGRQVMNFDQKLWEQNRFGIVVDGNEAKFNADPELKAFLMGTGNRILVEASPADRIWGIGLSGDDPMSNNPNLWKGENLLGFALMEVRDKLTH